MYCSNCGCEIPDDSHFCPECGSAIGVVKTEGYKPKSQVIYGTKSDIFALLLSLFIIGAGEIYVGKANKGVKLLILSIAVWVLAVVLSAFINDLIMIGFVTAVIWIYSMVDSYELVQEYNQALRDTGYPPW